MDQTARVPPALAASAPVDLLCRSHPPFGLLERPAKRSRSADELARCRAFVARLQQGSSNWSALPPGRYDSCAVVGSSGILRRAGYGREIDRHDAIFRFNYAPVGLKERLASDIGVRTSYRLATHFPHEDIRENPWRVTASSLRKRQALEATARAALLLYCHNPWMGVCQRAAVDTPNGPARLVNPLLVEWVAALQQHFGRRARVVSSGMAGIAVALAACARVRLFGFGNASDASQGAVCWRYWDCRHNQSAFLHGRSDYGRVTRVHHWRAQWAAIETLIRAGRVTYRGRAASVSATDAARAARMISHTAPVADEVERSYV